MFAKNRWSGYSCTGKDGDDKLVDLYHATKDGKANIVKLLVTKGEVNAQNVHKREVSGQGLTALHIAARYNHLDCLKILIMHGANVNATDKFGFRPIHDAAMHGHAECMQELLNHGAETSGVNCTGFEYITPMYYAVKYNFLSCLQILEGIESYDPVECDRLIWKLGASNVDFSLLQRSLDYDIPDEEFEECLRRSAVTGNVKYFQNIQQCLTKRDMNMEELSRKYGYLVIIATQHGHLKYLGHLLEVKFDSNEKNDNDSTALHYAARYGHPEAVKLLVKHGAELNALDADKWTPLHIALKQNNMETVAELISSGCDVNAPGGMNDDTPLHVALTTPVSTETLRQLLDAKPKMVNKNKKGLSPIDVCEKSEEKDGIYQTLMEYVCN